MAAVARPRRVRHADSAIRHVRARAAQRWRVVDARAYDDCQLITLSGLGPKNSGVERGSSRRSTRSSRFRRRRGSGSSNTAWRRACRELLSHSFSERHLCAAGRARIELLPHQLEPAIALVRGDGCRVLLADDVGLGKTIQAGLAIAELRARGAADRVLIITPAGLREQWAGELSERFGSPGRGRRFPARSPRRRVVPRASTRGRPGRSRSRRSTTSSAPEVLPAVAALRWDVIVVDEAHGLAGDSDRHEAVAALAARVPYVVLLTATPHNGDAARLRSLCAHRRSSTIALLVFRRTRHDVGHAAAGAPRASPAVRPSAEERRMHARLEAFARVRARGARTVDRGRLARAGRASQARATRAPTRCSADGRRRLASLGPEPTRRAERSCRCRSTTTGELDAADEAPGGGRR